MTHRFPVSGFLSTLLGLSLLILSGCQVSSVRDDDDTGNLGRNRGESPADIYVQLATGYLQEGQTDTALRKVRQGLELDPRNARAHMVIALIYERLGETGLAENHYAEAIGLEPKDPFIHNAYGSFLCKQKNYDQALKEFEAAVSNPLYPTPHVALANAGVCARRAGELSRAEGYLRQALQSDNKFPLALSQMAIVSFETGNALSARAYLQRFLEVADPSPDMLWLGIRIARELGNRALEAEYEGLLRQKFPDAREIQYLNESRR